MRIQWFQHVPFEGLGTIEDWARARGHPLQCTRFFAGDPAPEPAQYEMLVVMGGPMGTSDEASRPWLGAEKAALRAAIESGKTVVGICLGAQLIAEALGARVFRNPEKEVGWFPVEFTAEARDALPGLPAREDVFHWHGDTFTLPEGAVLLASSEACAHQGFLWNGRVLALQFHLETTPEGAAALARECPGDLRPEPFVQTRNALFAEPARFARANQMMSGILDASAEWSTRAQR